MTAEHEQQTPVGIELDALVAVHVMGVKAVYYPGYAKEGKRPPYYIPSGHPWETHAISSKPLPKYSTEIVAAWEVVEAVRKRGWLVRIEHASVSEGVADAGTSAEAEPYWRVAIWTTDAHVPHIAPTVAAAICRAALLATGGTTLAT